MQDVTTETIGEHLTIRVLQIEETYHDLRADFTALLMIHNCMSDDDYDNNSLERLRWERLCMLDQHIHDIKALCGFDD